MHGTAMFRQASLHNVHMQLQARAYVHQHKYCADKNQATAGIRHPQKALRQHAGTAAG
jgi:hypothetical protein